MVFWRALLFNLGMLLCCSANAWFDNDWTYRAAFNVNNPGGTLTDQQIQIDLSSANVHPDYVWSSDGDDIRILASDDSTALDYYIENWDSFSETAVIYVRLDNLPPGDSTILLYYGNTLAPDASDPIGVLTEIGLRYHTRQSSLDPTSRTQALNEFNSLGDNVVGYGCKQVTEFTAINNNNQFPSGSNSEILFFSNNHFEVPPAFSGLWRFRFGGDYGRGGGMYLDNIDSDEKWNDDLWWSLNFGNTGEILQVEGTLTSGFHNVQMIGAEGCCDGGTSVEYQSPEEPGVWKVWNTANVNIRSEKCTVTSIPTTLASSSLVTSTKTALDLNGGDLEVGDVIRYTITLNESAGTTAEFVTVTDDLPSQVTDLTIVAITGSGIDDSDPTRNGDGQVLVEEIIVPANGSVSILFDVTVATVPVGQTIDNSATIENLSGGADVIVVAPTLTVSINEPNITGVKNLYLYNDNSLTRVVPGTDQSFLLIDEQFDSETWTLSTALQTPLTVDKSIDQSIALYMRRAGETGYAFREIRIRVSGSASGVIAEYSNSSISIPAGTGFSLFALTLDYINPSPLTLAQGEAITLEIINESQDFISGGAGPVYNDDIEVYLSNTVGTTPNTILSFPSGTVINVDEVETYNDAFPAGVLTSAFNPGSSVYVRATVSDPFGAADINSATVDIINAAGSTVVTGAVMTEIGATGASKTYEYQYDIVGLPPQGAWTATVTANEGTEGTISDTGTGTFSVYHPPSLTTVITANTALAAPSTPVIYTVITTNSGAGNAISVRVTDDIGLFMALRLDTYGADTPLNCNAGCPSSGLTLGAPVFSNDDASSFVYTPVSEGGGAPANYDSNVTHWRVPMTGSLSGSGTSFTIQFETLVR
ncbi:MAG: putative repeat protein (TIGR01451 family) [Candidatus Azotimanducaceae bacterium]